jgi:histidine phosphatase superfamily protein (branch 1)
MAKRTCPAIAATAASFQVSRRFCRERQFGLRAILREHIKRRRRSSSRGISVRRLNFSKTRTLPSNISGIGRGSIARPYLMGRKQDPDSFWYATADERAPNGESFVDLLTRVGAAIARVTQAHQGRDIVAVAHGGTIRAAISIALGLPPRGGFAFMIDNCSLTRLDHYQSKQGSGWRVAMVNHRP